MSIATPLPQRMMPARRAPMPGRLHGPPRPVADELIRARLVERLAGRWEVPVTTVVAGPGFGKTTALAQAVRLHQVNPCGIEAWLTCEPGHEDGRRLSAAVCRALDADGAIADPVEAAVEALQASSPLPTCLILDDVHELPADSSGQHLVGQIIRRLPARAHLVLAGRSLHGIALARLRAADRVLSIGEDDLCFSGPELDQLAGQAGRVLANVAGLGGWPALVRLSLRAPPGVARDYLWEEVLSTISDAERRILLSLAVLGNADAATLSAVVGVPVDLDALCQRIPLIRRISDDEVHAHPLWMDALGRLLPPQEVRAARRSAAELLLRRNEALPAGGIALAAADFDLLARASTLLVQTTTATFPYETGRRWLAAVPADGPARPGLLLLDAATRQATSATDADVDALVDAAEAAARAAGDREIEIAALTLGTAAAYLRGDEPRLFDLFQRSVEVPHGDRTPILRMLGGTVQAAMAELVGTVDDGIAVLESFPDGDIDLDRSHSVVRLHVHLLLLAGRADEAVALADRHLATSSYPHVRRMPLLARWMAGRPGRLLRLLAGSTAELLLSPDASANARLRLNYLAYGMVIAASLGARDALRTLAAQLDLTGAGIDHRDGAVLVVATAARAVAEGDEPAASEAIAQYLRLHPVSDATVSVHLRRFLAYGYVLSPEARRSWDAAPLGPAHQRVRAVARALVAARADRPIGDLAEPAAVLTALPLPWAVELAASAHAAGARGGAELIQWLLDHIGAPVHAELRRLAARPTGTGSTGARRLLSRVPATPARRTRVEVLGPLRILVDGSPTHPVQLRRRRVRELLAVLAVHGELDRTRAMDLLWPDLDPGAAARNLRVTLTYLRQALEPDRLPGDLGYHLRVNGDRIHLARSASLEVDLAELRDHLTRVRHATAAGDPTEAERGMAAAMRLWRGDPLADLSGLPALAPEVSALRAELTEAALTFGERRLAVGDTTEARASAERVLVGEPYAERALRLLLAVELERRDPATIRRAALRVRKSLAALDATPSPATAMVLHQASLAGTARRASR